VGSSWVRYDQRHADEQFERRAPETHAELGGGESDCKKIAEIENGVQAAFLLLSSTRCAPENVAPLGRHIAEKMRKIGLQAASWPDLNAADYHSREAALAQCEAYERLCYEYRRRHSLPMPGQRSVGRWIGRAVTALAAGVVLALGLTQPWVSDSRGPWRGAYYSTDDLRGEPIVRYERNLEFDWGKEAPMDAIPGESFSVRWDTCIEIEEEQNVVWQVVVDDGARLTIDGKRVLDMWKNGKQRSDGVTTHLSAGVHHLSLEYYDDRGLASVHLLASFDGRAPRSLRRKMLKRPHGAIGASEPCRKHSFSE
jgi:hypothetical protein